MTELGRILREAREKKGLTLDDVHKQTKIQKRYLEAIEEGNLEALPGHFYARAFIKSYAEVVDLPTETVTEFLQTAPPKPLPVEEPAKPLRRDRQLKSGQSSKWVSRALLYSFAVLILFVIYIAISEYGKKTSPSAELPPGSSTVKPSEPAGNSNTNGAAPTQGQAQAPAPASVPTPTPAPPEQTENKPTVALAFVGQEGNVFHYEAAGVTDMNVKLTATGDCWMRVQKGGANGEKLEEVTLTSGMNKQYSFGNQDAWIRMGSAPDVTVEVNGTPLDTSKMARASQILWISIKK